MKFKHVFTRHLHLHWLFTACILLTAACGRRSAYPDKLVQAEKIINAHPDSALSLLQTIDGQLENEPEETRMYHTMLTIKAKDKLYIPHTSDSLILPVVHFYEKYGDKARLTEAYFYLGSTYRDMNDAPRALKAFHQAAETGEKSDMNRLSGMIYGQMGSLFAYQKIYDEALRMYKISKNYYERQGDSLFYAGTLQNIARAYDGKQKKDSAEWYYKEALRIYKHLSYDKKIINISAELGCFYFDIGKKELSKSFLTEALHNHYRGSNVLSYMGHIYQDEGKIDSANYYFHEVIKNGDYRKQCYAYYCLAKLEEQQGNKQAAAQYREQYRLMQDSLNAITQSDMMEKLHLTYNYQYEEHKNYQLDRKNQIYRQYIYLLLSCLAATILLGIMATQHIRRKKQAAIEQEKRLRHVQEEKYRQSQACMEANERQIQELAQKLEEATANNDALQSQLLLSQKEMLELSNRQNLALQDNQKLLETAFHQSDIYILFHKAGNEESSIKVTEELWKELQSALDITYSHFTDRLYALYPRLSQHELRICYLVKTGIPVKGIAWLLSRSKAAITVCRGRLYKKIHGTEGTGEKMDQFISDF